MCCLFLFACVVTLLQQNGTWADEPALAPRHLTTVNKKKIVCVLFLTSSQEPVEVFFFISVFSFRLRKRPGTPLERDY